jgi:hypothetical protein
MVASHHELLNQNEHVVFSVVKETLYNAEMFPEISKTEQIPTVSPVKARHFEQLVISNLKNVPEKRSFRDRKVPFVQGIISSSLFHSEYSKIFM